MSLLASATPVWISAISTAVIGGLGLVFTGWQFWVNGFRPRFEAFRETNGDAIELRARNAGRQSGLIHSVSVIDERQLRVDGVQIDGFPNGAFEPLVLPGSAAMRLVIAAPDARHFTGSEKVKVRWGKHARELTPQPVDVGLYGTRSLLPPQSWQ